MVSWATKWILVSLPKKYHIPKFVVQKWVLPIKNGVNKNGKNNKHSAPKRKCSADRYHPNIARWITKWYTKPFITEIGGIERHEKSVAKERAERLARRVAICGGTGVFSRKQS